MTIRTGRRAAERPGIWSAPMRAVATVLIVTFGIAAETPPASANRWLSDLWQRLDEERF
jgi:hypothetical protein